MNKRKCPLQLDHFVYIPTIRSLEPISVFSKDLGEILYTLLAFVRFQKRDGVEQVDLGASLRIPGGQILGFSDELFSILELSLFLAPLCVLEERGSFFQRLINVGHAESLCHRANPGWRNIPFHSLSRQSRCRTVQGVPWIMDETYLQRPGSGSVDVLLREEPDEEEEDEEENDGDEEDDDGDDGYSE